jgi:hypothetical protein
LTFQRKIGSNGNCVQIICSNKRVIRCYFFEHIGKFVRIFDRIYLLDKLWRRSAVIITGGKRHQQQSGRRQKDTQGREDEPAPKIVSIVFSINNTLIPASAKPTLQKAIVSGVHLPWALIH